MDGMSVLEFAMNRVPKNILSILEYTKRNIKDVDLFALHQANRFIINAIRKKMNIENKLMPNNIRDFGNTGSASIPLLLSDILGIKKQAIYHPLFSPGLVSVCHGALLSAISQIHLYSILSIVNAEYI
jgi:3-oxoacyl-[acyl-carrier-protein] synthase-3